MSPRKRNREATRMERYSLRKKEYLKAEIKRRLAEEDKEPSTRIQSDLKVFNSSVKKAESYSTQLY